MIFFDHASATPIDRRVLAAMEPYFSEKFYNPSGAYSLSRDVKADYNDAKHRIASLIGAKPAEIIMTAGATESINLAFKVPRVKKSKILISAIEHDAVRQAALCEKTFTRVGVVAVDKTGRLDISDLKKQLTDEVVLVSIGYANNEIGTVQDIKEVSEIISNMRRERLARNIATPLYLHTDASQAAGYLDLNVARLGVDLMTLNAGKCYGPKQVGLLYVKAGTRLEPSIVGGGQEMGFRSGTENVAGTIGLARALEIAEKKRKSEVKRLNELRRELIRFVEDGLSAIASFTINGNRKHCLPNLLSISIEGVDGERLVYALDQRGVQIATGSACAANKGTRSHVLTSIGLADGLADGSIRISTGRETTINEVDKFKPILLEVIKNEKKLS